jgi:hypothetical protein
MSRSRSVRAEDARRARIILSLASGSLSLWAISRQERCSINTMRMWRDRFKEQRADRPGESGNTLKLCLGLSQASRTY